MEGKCKHWGHKETRGVCPYCLKEKLEQLTMASSMASSTTILSSSTASSAACSSYKSSSFDASPRNRHHSKKTLLYLFKGGKEEPLRRSSSLAFPIGEGKERKEEEEQEKKIKRRSVRSGSMFWAKFVSAGEGRRKERKLEGLYHSKTAKEKPSSRWPIFVQKNLNKIYGSYSK
ncbi:uncharacterized protein LOC110028917 [Phalaenopsis equestris]|uniref:uncharacterized protein LOC110028917 n=1 Tax=Phalaenopsis equestris TaxID=78828 RepID=UPI0009E2C5C0|nr:uncharacterized protein LOC110028917 [Phalaenopsis equestris]